MEFRRRGSGAHGLADVAAGLNDAYVELHINARDALASIPLVREAGGLTNDFLEGDGLVLQLSLLVDQEFGGLSFPVAGFGDGLMEPAPERPSENEVDAEAGAQLEAGDEAADLGHAECNWDECARSPAPFWPARLTRIAARKASASIDRVTWRYQPCQLRTS